MMSLVLTNGHGFYKSEQFSHCLETISSGQERICRVVVGGDGDGINHGRPTVASLVPPHMPTLEDVPNITKVMRRII